MRLEIDYTSRYAYCIPGRLIALLLLLLTCPSVTNANRHRDASLLQHRLRERPVSNNSLRFPIGTMFAACQEKGGTLLWATMQKLYNSRTGAEFAFPKDGFRCIRIAWSADQKRLLVLGEKGAFGNDPYVTDAYVLEAASLRFVRHMKTSVAWWQGSQYAYLDEEQNCIRFTTDNPCVVPDGLEICAADSQTGRLLYGTLLPREPRYEGPSYLMQIGKLTSRNRLQRIRILGKMHFDPGSSGVPRAFGLAGWQHVILGQPHGGVFDTLQMVKGKRITPLFADKGKGDLANQQGPYAAGNTLFGLLEELGDQPHKERFIYQVSATAVTLTKIEDQVLFVYFDPMRQAIGLGSPTAAGVVVHFMPVKSPISETDPENFIAQK